MRKILYPFISIHRLIGSTLFLIFMSLYTIPYSFISLACYKLPYRIRYRVIQFWMTSMLFMLKILCGIRYKITGLENIPDFPCVVMSKHQSTFETFALPKLFHCPAIILKKELLNIPFFGWGLKLLEPISIDRKQKATAMDQILKQGGEYLRSGRWVLVFPEGTRIEPGKTARYRVGGALLACKTGFPVIPVAHNAGLLWPRTGFLKKPGVVHIKIGPVIDTQDKEAEEVLNLVRHWIETTMPNL